MAQRSYTGCPENLTNFTLHRAEQVPTSWLQLVGVFWRLWHYRRSHAGYFIDSEMSPEKIRNCLLIWQQVGRLDADRTSNKSHGLCLCLYEQLRSYSRLRGFVFTTCISLSYLQERSLSCYLYVFLCVRLWTIWSILTKRGMGFTPLEATVTSYIVISHNQNYHYGRLANFWGGCDAKPVTSGP
jgi:hypothetical protein